MKTRDKMIRNWVPKNQHEIDLVLAKFLEMYGFDYESVNASGLQRNMALRSVAENIIGNN